MKLTDNTILITGGAAGIGLALAKQFSQNNEVIICGRNDATLQAAKTEVPSLVTRVCDVADPASRRAMVDWLRATYPALNVLINNAGVQARPQSACLRPLAFFPELPGMRVGTG